MLKKNIFVFLLVITAFVHTSNSICAESRFYKPTKNQIIVGVGAGVTFVCFMAYLFWPKHKEENDPKCTQILKEIEDGLARPESGAKTQSFNYVVEKSDNQEVNILWITKFNLLSDIFFLQNENIQRLDGYVHAIETLPLDDITTYRRTIDNKLQEIGYKKSDNVFKLGSAVKTLTGKTYDKLLDPAYKEITTYIKAGEEYVKVSEIINTIRVLEDPNITTENAEIISMNNKNSYFLQKKYFFENHDTNSSQLGTIFLRLKKQEKM